MSVLSLRLTWHFITIYLSSPLNPLLNGNHLWTLTNMSIQYLISLDAISVSLVFVCIKKRYVHKSAVWNYLSSPLNPPLNKRFTISGPSQRYQYNNITPLTSLLFLHLSKCVSRLTCFFIWNYLSSPLNPLLNKRSTISSIPTSFSVVSAIIMGTCL